MTCSQASSSALRSSAARAALLAALAGVPLAARAECVTTVVGSRVIGFECTGLDPDGVRVTSSNILGEVAPGARVEGSDAVVVGDAATLINEGEIDGDGLGLSGGSDLTVLNEGRVAGGNSAMRVSDRFVLRNDAGAVVTGGGFGIVTDEDPVIVNAGTIRGDVTAIDGLGDIVVRNTSGGTIAGGTAIASPIAITLDNAGLIEGSIVPDLDATILNRRAGVIRGSVISGPGINSVENDGLIDGDVYATQGLGVANTGTLLGSISATDEGIGVGNTGVIRTPESAVVGTFSAEPFVSNDGAIVAGEDAVRGGINVFLDNTGSITAGDDGVDAAEGAFVTNSGTITAEDDGVVGAFGGEVENTGTIVAGSEGVEIGDGAEVVLGPDGAIRGDRTGVLGGEDLLVENRGLIRGGAGGAIRAGSGLDLDNRGRVEGVGGDGVVIDGSGSVNVFNGTITADGVAIRASGSVFVNVDIPGSITGGEAGIVGGDGSSVFVLEFRSSIKARGDAVRLGRGAQIINEDTIASTGTGDAVSIVDGEIDNQESGSLSAAGGAGVRVRAGEPGGGPTGPLTVSNQGSIAGVVGVQVDPSDRASQSITNFGSFGASVEGASGVAIDLGAGDDAVANLDGSGIFGDILLGAGDDALTLGSGGAITGDTLFGPGDDAFLYERSMLGEVMDDFGLFAGGAGFDEATFAGFGLGDLDASPVAGGFELLFEDGPSRLAATLTGFEAVRLDDATLSFPSSPAPIPLPAGLPMLAAALGGLAILRRRSLRSMPSVQSQAA